jgi:hypothetical protein
MIIAPIIIIVIQNMESTSSSGVDTTQLEVVARCPMCGWQDSYANKTRAAQALGRHRGHCRGKIMDSLGFGRRKK